MKQLSCAIVLCLLIGGIGDAEAKRRRRGKKKRPAPTTAVEEGDKKNTNRRVAVLQLVSLGLGADDAESLELYLRSSIATIEGFEVVEPIDLEIALKSPAGREAVNCGGGTSCAGKMGRLVEADVVVFGTVGAIGEAYNLNIRAVDTKSLREESKQRTNISGSRHLLIPEIRLAAYRLLAPDRITGSLLIEIDVEGVAVEVDGDLVGVTPMREPLKNLAPGDHVVVIKRPGYSAFQQEFSIKPFDTARLRLELKKQGDVEVAPAADGATPSDVPETP